MSDSKEIILSGGNLPVPELAIPETYIVNAAFPKFANAIGKSAGKLQEEINSISSIKKILNGKLTAMFQRALEKPLNMPDEELGRV